MHPRIMILPKCNEVLQSKKERKEENSDLFSVPGEDLTFFLFFDAGRRPGMEFKGFVRVQLTVALADILPLTKLSRSRINVG